MPPRNDKDGGEDITVDLYPFIREYKGGRVERFLRSPFVAATEDPAANRGVATRDVIIDNCTGVSARLFLPSDAAAAGERLPVIMYVHGGSFCTESAFGRTYNNYIRSLAARTGALVVSVEYRLAPEHPVPAAYDDAWAALQWVASLSDPWLSSYADPERTFLAGDSAGGNIVYNTAVRAAGRGTNIVDIEGLVIVHPYFWGVDRLSSSETVWDGVAMFTPDFVDRLWPYVTAGQLENDDPWINPLDGDIASLMCRRVLVAVAEKDSLSGRGRRLAASMRNLMWADDQHAVTLVESEAEDHGFHLYNPMRATSKTLMESIIQFINQRPALPLPAAFPPERHELHLHACQGKDQTSYSAVQPILGVPTRPYVDVFGYGVAMKDSSGPKNTTRTSCLQIGGHERRSSPRTRRYGLSLGHPITSNMRFPLSATTSPGGGCVHFHKFMTI
ncbi:probable carboxylesterase 3 [Triticum aestivum]|uniref:probable carboxylesterase 3 n=1 Tax=Triticum aestivum TaxID=4565 RepID=UPI00162B73B3|nr:probable carboxylesterase 3 [Triticum aestivum]